MAPLFLPRDKINLLVCSLESYIDLPFAVDNIELDTESGKYTRMQKVLTYVEYRAVSGVFQKYDPPPPSPSSECVLPPHQRREGAVRGVGGSIFWKTPDIGLTSYSIISIRSHGTKNLFKEKRQTKIYVT
jgi:hypothetical protein